ncbi:sensor histidine kinase [Nonomuraea basaltis]|uniref:sensor histidine kinase n=1 Tax=Nonomuraea basaltis TaxID=2495887 RepID=UPI00110C5D5A|nr:sensor histidine kinase [Nonomuraea basaltis]TMR91388.1 sensor histidine kinase [Nonomuraea basaltis]
MVTEHTHRGGRLRRPLAALSRLSRLGDVPVVVMLAWAGWLAVPWSFSGLAQARAAAAAAADTEPPQLQISAEFQDGEPGRQLATSAAARHGAANQVAWGIPAARTAQLKTVRPPAREGTLYGTPPATNDSALAGPRAEADALALERARIAGEVHDAAGHGLAAIAMQAGLALVTLDDDPEQARASLRAIRETSTTALAQLRAALDGIDPPGGDLTGLIDGMRAAGLLVDVEPPGFSVPAHLQGTVYRVVRESLTNVLRHAGPNRALVRVSDDPHEFVLEVADRGLGWAGSGEGRGLAGMRARVAEAGGRFTAGPREGGGFQVVARFPAGLGVTGRPGG